MTRLWWVRHGPTHARSLAGWRDIPADLSDHAALARLNAHLPQGAIVVSSDLVRASATADALSGGRQRLPDLAGLREISFGEWEGQSFASIEARWPELSRRFWEEPGDVAPPGGESWNGAAARVRAAVDALCAQHQGADLVAVAHHGAILTQFARAAGLTPYQALAQPIRPLSLTCLALDPGGWSVCCVDHLA